MLCVYPNIRQTVCLRTFIRLPPVSFTRHSFIFLSVISLSFVISVVFPASKNVFRGLKLLRGVLTMRSSPTRKYDNFSNDQQGKDTDKNSLDSQDTASVVSSLFILLIFVCIRDVIDLLMY